MCASKPTSALRRAIPWSFLGLFVLAAPSLAGLLGIDAAYMLHDINTSNGAITNPRFTGDKINMIAISPGGILYGVSQGTPTDVPAGGMLYKLNITTGVPTLVDTLDQYIFVEGDIACDPTTGILYGVEAPGTLLRINTTTAQVTVVGTVGTNLDLSAMTFDAAGNLYMVNSFTMELLAVNKANGAIINTVPLDPLNQEIGGLAFSPGGTLFHAAGTASKLYTLNTVNGNVLTIGPVAGSGGIWALTWAPDPTTIEPSTWSRVKTLLP